MSVVLYNILNVKYLVRSPLRQTFIYEKLRFPRRVYYIVTRANYIIFFAFTFQKYNNIKSFAGAESRSPTGTLYATIIIRDVRGGAGGKLACRSRKTENNHVKSQVPPICLLPTKFPNGGVTRLLLLLLLCSSGVFE